MNPVNTTVTVHVYIGLALKAFTLHYRYGRKPSPHNCGQEIICLRVFHFGCNTKFTVYFAQ